MTCHQTANVCVPFAQEGDSCAEVECRYSMDWFDDDALWCNEASICERVFLHEGAPCTDDETDPMCEPDTLVCSSDHVCVPRAEEGAPCTALADLPSYQEWGWYYECADGLSCSPDGFCEAICAP